MSKNFSITKDNSEMDQPVITMIKIKSEKGPERERQGELKKIILNHSTNLN